MPNFFIKPIDKVGKYVYNSGKTAETSGISFHGGKPYAIRSSLPQNAMLTLSD